MSAASAAAGNDMAKKPSTVILINSGAGAMNPRGARADELRYHAARILPDALVTETESEESARAAAERALKGGASIIACAGGDGSAHLLAELLAGKDAAMGIIPSGTANNVARSLGLPMSVRGALLALRRGRARRFDLGAANDRVFIEAAGIGFHADVLRAYHLTRVKSVARGVYALAKTFSACEPFVVRLEADGGRRLVMSALQLTVSNLPLYGTGFRIAPGARADDGLLDATVICDARAAAVPAMAAFAWAGALDFFPGVRRFRFSRLKIETDSPTPVHVDAAAPLETPVVIETRRAALKIVV